jgi:hypothetical protein
MSKRILFASITSMCVLANCTPYQEIDRDEPPGDVSSPAEADPSASAPAEADAEFKASTADGGAGQVDSAVAAVYKIRASADIAPAATAMMTLADKDEDGQITLEEYDLLAPALAQADNTQSANDDGSTAEKQGAAEYAETADGTPISAEEFFNETAGADATISREDLASALTARFETADADGDGTLTAEEAATFSASMRLARN